MRDYYRLMGLPFGASVDEVRARYRELARRYHPDVSRDPDAGEKMRLLNEAYQVLSDPQLRLRYHLLVLAQRQRRRRKALKRLRMVYRSAVARPQVYEAPPYLRYLLVGLLTGIAMATAVYHYYHPFVVSRVHLAGYGWSVWPPFLELPSSVAELYLQDNRFTEVPPVVWSLSGLRVLRLDGNRLEYLSSRITTLTELEALSLRENRLSVLPRGWGDMARLREIDLRNNRLSEVPLELLELPHLQRLDLRGNPLSPQMQLVLARRRHPAVLWESL